MTKRLLKKYGAQLGENINFKGGIIIDNATKDKDSTNDYRNIIIGNRSYIGRRVFFDIPNRIVIEDEALISAGVSIFTHAECGNRFMSNYFPMKTGSVKIGKRSWVGANVIILSGVKIGENCVVAAGSVINRSFGSNEVIAGIPARRIGDPMDFKKNIKMPEYDF